jgi:hypothetical protein
MPAAPVQASSQPSFRIAHSAPSWPRCRACHLPLQAILLPHFWIQLLQPIEKDSSIQKPYVIAAVNIAAAADMDKEASR